MPNAETVSLVLEAGTIARPGHINVLKMDEPVRNYPHCTQPHRPHLGKNIGIGFTIIRIDEEMQEELYIRDNELETGRLDIPKPSDGDRDVVDGKLFFEGLDEKSID
jgi:FlaA1/EpsC-like NDP-sugar epimerase